MGTAVLYNARVRSHKDTKDVRGGYTAMTCFGPFDGGELVLPQLGENGKALKIEYQPGQIICFASSAIEHGIAPVTGERASVVFFTHNDTLQTPLKEAINAIPDSIRSSFKSVFPRHH